MPAGKMHADEVDTDAPLVRRLLAAQFPQWADLRIEPVPSAGTDNAIYRLGDDMAVRLPRAQSSLPLHLVAQIDDYLARLGPFDPVFVHSDLGGRTCSSRTVASPGSSTGATRW